MTKTVLKSRLGVKAQVVLPKPVREALGLKPGDAFLFVLGDGAVSIERAPPAGDDPFASFTEWASEADSEGYAHL